MFLGDCDVVLKLEGKLEKNVELYIPRKVGYSNTIVSPVGKVFEAMLGKTQNHLDVVTWVHFYLRLHQRPLGRA